MSERRLRAVTIGVLHRHDDRVTLLDYDPQWPRRFEDEAACIRKALSERALRLEHVGSTSVPELVAKPVIDMLLEVADSADETAYVPALEAAGYVLRIREPDWYQHRLFKGPRVDINLHVFSRSSPEAERMILFRDRLRADREARKFYAEEKCRLAAQRWEYVQDYADAKSAAIAKLLR